MSSLVNTINFINQQFNANIDASLTIEQIISSVQESITAEYATFPLPTDPAELETVLGKQAENLMSLTNAVAQAYEFDHGTSTIAPDYVFYDHSQTQAALFPDVTVSDTGHLNDELFVDFLPDEYVPDYFYPEGDQVIVEAPSFFDPNLIPNVSVSDGGHQGDVVFAEINQPIVDHPNDQQTPFLVDDTGMVEPEVEYHDYVMPVEVTTIDGGTDGNQGMIVMPDMVIAVEPIVEHAPDVQMPIYDFPDGSVSDGGHLGDVAFVDPAPEDGYVSVGGPMPVIVDDSGMGGGIILADDSDMGGPNHGEPYYINDYPPTEGEPYNGGVETGGEMISTFSNAINHVSHQFGINIDKSLPYEEMISSVQSSLETVYANMIYANGGPPADNPTSVQNGVNFHNAVITNALDALKQAHQYDLGEGGSPPDLEAVFFTTYDYRVDEPVMVDDTGMGSGSLGGPTEGEPFEGSITPDPEPRDGVEASDPQPHANEGDPVPVIADGDGAFVDVPVLVIADDDGAFVDVPVLVDDTGMGLPVKSDPEPVDYTDLGYPSPKSDPEPIDPVAVTPPELTNVEPVAVTPPILTNDQVVIIVSEPPVVVVSVDDSQLGDINPNVYEIVPDMVIAVEPVIEYQLPEIVDETGTVPVLEQTPDIGVLSDIDWQLIPDVSVADPVLEQTPDIRVLSEEPGVFVDVPVPVIVDDSGMGDPNHGEPIYINDAPPIGEPVIVVDTTVQRDIPDISVSDRPADQIIEVIIPVDEPIVTIQVNEILGSKFADAVTGTTGVDHISTGDGRDKLSGGEGGDILEGGKGADKLDGGVGLDTVSYVNSDAGVNVNFKTGFGSGGEATGDRYTSIENATGSSHNDSFTGNSQANSFEGLAGNDTFKADLGADRYDGGEGIDTLSYANSKEGVEVTLEPFRYWGGAAPTEEMLADLAENYVNGKGGDAEGDHIIGVENLTGSKHADKLSGNDDRNVIEGGKGHDTINGNNGDDVLSGGAGNDTFIVSFGAGNDVITDFMAGSKSGDKIVFEQVNDGSHAILTYKELMANAQQDGANLIFNFGDQHLTLNNVMKSQMTMDDFAFVVNEPLAIPMSAGPQGGNGDMPPDFMV